MRLFNFFNRYTALLFVIAGLIVAILTIFILPKIVILPGYLLVFFGMLIDNTEKHPFGVSKRPKKGWGIDTDWDDTLVYTYNITFLKVCFWITSKLNKDEIYSFTPFQDIPQDTRESIINKYFDKQS